MINIVNIDYSKNLYGVSSVNGNTNSLQVLLCPHVLQKNNIKIEIVDYTGSSHLINAVLDNGKINYYVPFNYWQGKGIMKIRLKSDEYTTEYIEFSIPNVLSNDDNIIVKENGESYIINAVSYKSSDSLIDIFLPIGTVITNSKAAFNPNTLYAGTTWIRIKGRVIVGIDENDADFSTVGKTGGAKTFNNSHDHTTASIALKAAQLPILTGSLLFHGAGSGGATVLNGGSCTGIIQARTVRSAYRSGGGNLSGATSADGINIGFGGNQAHGHGNTGSSGSTAQSLLQPYITKYVWERTA